MKELDMDLEIFEKILQRERAARELAEELLEERSRELYLEHESLEAAYEDQLKFASYVNTSRDLVCFISLDTKQVRFINNSGLKMLGFSSFEQVLFRNIFEVLPNDIQNFLENGIEKAAIKKRWNGIGQLQNLPNNQNLIVLIDLFVVIHQRNGSEICLALVMRNITKLKQSEKELIARTKELERINNELVNTQHQLVQSEKMASLGVLAAGVAHEINNPLSFIMSNLGVLSDYNRIFSKLVGLYREMMICMSKQETDRVREILWQIKSIENSENISYVLDDCVKLLKETLDGAERVKEIVQDLKSFSRIDENELKEASINDCINSTLKVIWNELKYKCEVHKDFAELPPIVCYPSQLKQVFMNILINAAQAMPNFGTIAIKTFAEGANQVINISDNGVGIPESVIHKIFDPFFTTKEIGKGTGLGLSISYEIIKKHNGSISVESQVGKGTVFTIKLPFDGRKINHDRQS